MQECLDLFAGVLPSQPRTRLRRRARRIRRDLAEVRDADVLLALIRSLRGKVSRTARPSLEALERRLAARAQSLRRDPAAGGRRRIRIAGIRKRAGTLLRAVKPVARSAASGRIGGIARRTLEARAGAVRRALRRAGGGRSADLHRLRVAIKRYRYTLEMLEAWGLSELKPELATARRIQEALGVVHDMDVLIAWMSREAAPAPIMKWVRAQRRSLAAAALATVAGYRPIASVSEVPG